MPGVGKADGRFRRPLTALALLVLVSAALTPVFFLLRSLTQVAGGSPDFANFYVAGTILRQGRGKQLYDLRLQRSLQQEISSGPFLPFIHPPFDAWLWLPLSYLSYANAFLVWSAINLALFFLLVYLLRFTRLRLCGGPYAVWLGVCLSLLLGVLALGQDTLLLALVFLSAFFALKKQRDVVAGLVLGAGLFRFEILAPFAFIFLLRGRWKLLAGFSFAGLLALLASVALVGWQGLVGYGSLLLRVGRTAGSQATSVHVATMPSLRGALASFLAGAVPSFLLLPIVVAGSLLLVGWAAWQYKSISSPHAPTFDLEFSMAVIAALLSSYHLFVHELTPLMVVGYLMLGYEGTRPREGLLGNRRGTALLFLFAAVFFVGAYADFRDFSVQFVVLLGMVVWLSQELSALRRPEAVG